MAPHITVVGSFAVGLTMKVERFPASGETQLGSGYRVDHGGKGSNQAVGCARLGAEVAFVAHVGEDAFGKMALDLYKNEGVETTWLRETPGRPTGVGFILVRSASGENCIALDPGANDLLNAEAVLGSGAAFDAARVVLTQLEIPVEAAAAALAVGRERGAITILNPAPARTLPSHVLELADILTPNEIEAKALLGYEPDVKIPAEELARQLRTRGAKCVCVTLGEAGALLSTTTGEIEIPAIHVPAVDSTGAGDAFNAGLAVALGNGASLETAARFGVVAGGLAVTKEGVIPALPRRDEVLAFLVGNQMPVPDWLRS